MPNQLIPPDQFVKEVIAAMHKAEDEHGLPRWSLFLAWAKESPFVELRDGDTRNGD